MNSPRREAAPGQVDGVHRGRRAARGRVRAHAQLVKGPGPDSPHGNGVWSKQLVDDLEILAREPWEIGVTEISIDGSFLEDKDHPNDLDGYFECDWREFVSGALQDRLNQLDPHRVWTWDPSERRPYRSYPAGHDDHTGTRSSSTVERASRILEALGGELVSELEPGPRA